MLYSNVKAFIATLRWSLPSSPKGFTAVIQVCHITGYDEKRHNWTQSGRTSEAFNAATAKTLAPVLQQEAPDLHRK
jgi:hypothetical protein